MAVAMDCNPIMIIETLHLQCGQVLSVPNGVVDK